MRKFTSLAVAVGLVLALASGSTTAAAAQPAQLLGTFLPGTLADNGGPAGFAAAQGLDPAVGRELGASASNPITTSLNGSQATISVANCCAQWSVGSAVGDATGGETLTATNAQVTFDSEPKFFTVTDMAKLMPPLTFTFATYNKGYPYKLQYWGHYVMDFSTGQVAIDDRTVKLDRPNNHPPITQNNTAKMDAGVLAGSPVITDQLTKAFTGSATTGTAQLNTGTAQIYQAYAKSVTFGLGTAKVPYTFGYSLGGLAGGQQATIDPSAAIAGSWLAGLSSAPTTGVPVSFADQSVNWRKAFDAKLLTTIAGTSLEDSFQAAFDHAFSYDRLVSVIEARTDADMAKDLDPVVKQFLDGVAAGVDAATARIETIPDYPNWYGQVTMDKINGITQWTDVSEAPKIMYPTVQADTTTKLVAMIKEKVAGSWYDLVKQHLSGTATLSKAFTPGPIANLRLTNTTSATKLTTPESLRLSVGGSLPVTASVAGAPAGTTTTLTYASANPAVATVGSDGQVRGAGAGSTTVTVTATLTCPGVAAATLVNQVPVSVAQWNGPPPVARLTATPTTGRVVGPSATSGVTLKAEVYAGTATGGQGAALSGQAVSFAVPQAVGGQPALSANSCTTGQDGSCQVTVSSTRADAFAVTATVAGFTLDGSPATLSWAPAALDKAKSSLAVSPPTVPVGESSRVSVTLADAYGNPLTGLTRSALGLSSTPDAVAFGSDFAEVAGRPGTYEVGATAAQPGSYTIAANPAGVSLSATLKVIAGVPAVLHATATATVVAGSAAQVTVKVTDSQGNAIDGLTGSQLVLNGGGLRVTSGPTGAGQGQYTWALATDKAGTYQPTVSAGALSASAAVHVVAGSPATVKLALAANPAKVGDAVALTVTVADAQGNGASVDLDVVAAAFTSQPDDVTASNWVAVKGADGQATGAYTAQLTGTTAGAHTLSLALAALPESSVTWTLTDKTVVNPTPTPTPTPTSTPTVQPAQDKTGLVARFIQTFLRPFIRALSNMFATVFGAFGMS